MAIFPSTMAIVCREADLAAADGTLTETKRTGPDELFVTVAKAPVISETTGVLMWAPVTTTFAILTSDAC
jgi:hypothetical protein